MSEATTAPLLEKLAASRARLLRGIDGLTDAALDAAPAAGGWSIRQHLTHLVASEEDHCRVIEVIVSGQLERLPRIERDPYNAQRLAELGVLTLSQLLAALVAQRRRTAALFARLEPAQLDLAGPHPVLGVMSVRDIFRILALHEQMHTREIAAIRAQANPG